MLNRTETKWSQICTLRDDISDLSAGNDLNSTVVEDSVTQEIEVGSNATTNRKSPVEERPQRRESTPENQHHDN